jgi:hypothetical protein
VELPQLASARKRISNKIKPIFPNENITWLGVCDVHVEDDDDDECDDGREPVDGEHDEDAEERAQQGNPLVVILVRKFRKKLWETGFKKPMLQICTDLEM